MHLSVILCSWLGNSESVARDSYLLVTDSHFQAATTPNLVHQRCDWMKRPKKNQAIRVLQVCCKKRHATAHKKKKPMKTLGKTKKARFPWLLSDGGGGN